METRSIGLVSVALLAMACGQVVATRTSPTSGQVPPQVAARSSLPLCGIEDATTQDGPWNPAARQCFWNAYEQKQPAEFISTSLTIEGDPITTIFRVLAVGKIEVFMDTTPDRFGEQDWWRFDCQTLAFVTTRPPTPDFGTDDSCTRTTLH